MSDTQFVMALLCAIITWQQFNIHRLINKIMSRSYHEYENALSLKKKQEIKVPRDDEYPEDLRVLSEFSRQI